MLMMLLLLLLLADQGAKLLLLPLPALLLPLLCALVCSWELPEKL